MNILIYLPDLSQGWGGIRQYASGLLSILSDDRDNHYYIYNNDDDAEVKRFDRKGNNFVFVSDEKVRPSFGAGIFNLLRRTVNFSFRLTKIKFRLDTPSTFDKLLKKYDIEVVHCPYQFIPQTSGIKLITTMHDVQEIHFPEYFSPEERAFRAVHYLDYLRRADKIIVSYNHVKMDLVNYFAVDEEKIHVILLDMQKLWFERFTNKDFVSLEKFSLPTDYLLYPANTWKHKNHLRLLDAIKNIFIKHNLKINFVFTGHTNDHFNEIKKKVKELEIEDQVYFCGTVSEEILFTLYKNCRGVVIPTTYEAGSFPLMESMILKVPVICSNVTSLPDTIGNEKFLFDPFSIDSMSDKIRAIWESQDFRNSSIENSNIQSNKFTRTDSLSLFQNLYSSL